MHKQAEDAAVSSATLKFFDWSFAKGATTAEELDYIPMPDAVVALVRKTLGHRDQGFQRQTDFCHKLTARFLWRKAANDLPPLEI